MSVISDDISQGGSNCDVDFTIGLDLRYKRGIYIALLPLLGSGSGRISAGCIFAVFVIIFSREAMPFKSTSTNILMVRAKLRLLIFVCILTKLDGQSR